MFLDWRLYITTSSLIFWEQQLWDQRTILTTSFCGGFVAIFDTHAFLTMGFVALICNRRIKHLVKVVLRWVTSNGDKCSNICCPKVVLPLIYEIGSLIMPTWNCSKLKIYLDLDFLLSNSLIDITYFISKWTTQEMPRLLPHVMNLIHHFVSNITWNCKGGLELYVMHLAIAIHNNQLVVFAPYMLGKNLNHTCMSTILGK